jgi:hypothetical protein
MRRISEPHTGTCAAAAAAEAAAAAVKTHAKPVVQVLLLTSVDTAALSALFSQYSVTFFNHVLNALTRQLLMLLLFCCC